MPALLPAGGRARAYTNPLPAPGIVLGCMQHTRLLAAGTCQLPSPHWLPHLPGSWCWARPTPCARTRQRACSGCSCGPAGARRSTGGRQPERARCVRLCWCVQGPPARSAAQHSTAGARAHCCCPAPAPVLALVLEWLCSHLGKAKWRFVLDTNTSTAPHLHRVRRHEVRHEPALRALHVAPRGHHIVHGGRRGLPARAQARRTHRRDKRPSHKVHGGRQGLPACVQAKRARARAGAAEGCLTGEMKHTDRSCNTDLLRAGAASNGAGLGRAARAGGCTPPGHLRPCPASCAPRVQGATGRGQGATGGGQEAIARAWARL